jgi:hypothetical protein
MDGIRATPYQRPVIGGVNDLIGGLLGYMRDPRRTQQMQGLAGLLESTGIPKTVERLAYNEPLTNIQQANIPTLRPETANALLSLLPVPSGANRAAMAAGRAGERMAERVVPQVMERGGVPAGLLDALSAQTVSPLTVYHGSPAKFSRFDPTKIGSGEGAQAYGYGHYVAESPSVAKQYRDTLSDEVVIYKGKPLKEDDPNTFLARFSSGNKTYGEDLVNFFDERVKESRAALKDKNPDWRTKATADALQKREELLQASKNFDQNAVEFQNQGSFYEIDLPDEQIAKMLDFDKPLMKQSKEIQALAKQYGLTDSDHLGGDLIAAMDAKRAAGAESMRQAGVPGIRYLDQGSRGVGDGTSNFVVFPGNEDLLTILKRNGGLLD